MNNELVMSFLTGLLVLVGAAQVMILMNQKRQNQLALLQEYRNRWGNNKRQWATVVFFGRQNGDYYQVAEKSLLVELNDTVNNHSYGSPTVIALESVQSVCNILSDICIRILQGQLEVKDVYPLFGSELLRHSRPLRVLLDVYYPLFHDPHELKNHNSIRKELQDWLIYHNGIRRRCLILMDLLWAEAVRLDDLSPGDIRSAANAKKVSGKINRDRLVAELKRVNSLPSPLKRMKLSFHMKNSELKRFRWQRGVCEKELKIREEKWVEMLLRNHK